MFLKLNRIPNSHFPEGEIFWLQSAAIETIASYMWGTNPNIPNVKNEGSYISLIGIDNYLYAKQSPLEIISDITRGEQL